MKDMSVCVGAAGSGAKPRRPGLEKRRRRRESGKPRRPGLAAARHRRLSACGPSAAPRAASPRFEASPLRLSDGLACRHTPSNLGAGGLGGWRVTSDTLTPVSERRASRDERHATRAPLMLREAPLSLP